MTLSMRSNLPIVPDLAPFLDRVYARYHDPALLGTDPLVKVRQFTDPGDREVAALFAALLAYGNVKQINRSLDELFRRFETGPSAFVRDFDSVRARRALKGFKHRFTDEQDVFVLSALLAAALRVGTLEEHFIRGIDPAASDFSSAAGSFVSFLLGQPLPGSVDRDRALGRQSFRHLLPNPERGSACKRLHLFFRWVVRPDDGIDLGLWGRVSTAGLLVPVDTHILRIASNMGLLKPGAASLRAARRITAVLREIDAADPVRFDFSLCRLGIMGQCPTHRDEAVCIACELAQVCRGTAGASRS